MLYQLTFASVVFFKHSFCNGIEIFFTRYRRSTVCCNAELAIPIGYSFDAQTSHIAMKQNELSLIEKLTA